MLWTVIGSITILCRLRMLRARRQSTVSRRLRRSIDSVQGGTHDEMSDYAISKHCWIDFQNISHNRANIYTVSQRTTTCG